MPDVPPPTATPAPAATSESAPDAAAPPTDTSPAASGAPSDGAAIAEKPPTLSERARLNRQQAALRHQRKELERQQAERDRQTQERLDAVLKQHDELRAEIRKRDEAMAKLQADPLNSISDPEARAAAIRKYAAGNTPEAKTMAELEARAAAEKELREELRKLREERENDRKELAERQTAASRQYIDQSIRAAVAGVTAAGAKYKFLNAECTPAEIEASFRNIHEWAVKNGKSYTPDQVAEHLDGEAKKLHEVRQQRREALLAAQAEPVSPTESKTGRAQASRATATEKVPKGPGSSTPPQHGSKRRREIVSREDMAKHLAMLKTAAAKDRTARDKN